MSDEGEKTCPLCAEEMDLTDQQLKPCKCGYDICVWCWHHIMDMAEKDDTEGRCPACRTPYNKEKIVGTASKCERLVAEMSVEKKQKSQKGKTKTSEGRKQLSTVRVIQRNLVYIVGLPLNLADEDILQRKEYFGQYGKVLKVSISRTAAGSIQHFANNTCSVYITYSKEDEAVRSIQSVHGFVLEGRQLRACFGTTKYCHAWLRNMPCTNPDCLYLHEFGSQEDSFTKDEIISEYTRGRVQQVTGGVINDMQRRSGNILPPAADDYINNSTSSWAKPNTKTTTNDPAYSMKGSPPNNSSSMKGSPPNSSNGRSVALPPAASWGTQASNSQPVPANVATSNGPSKQKTEVVSPSSRANETLKNHIEETSTTNGKSKSKVEPSESDESESSDKNLDVSDEGGIHKLSSDMSSSLSIGRSSWDDDNLLEPVTSNKAKKTADSVTNNNSVAREPDLVNKVEQQVAVSEVEADLLSFNDQRLRDPEVVTTHTSYTQNIPQSSHLNTLNMPLANGHGHSSNGDVNSHYEGSNGHSYFSGSRNQMGIFEDTTKRDYNNNNVNTNNGNGSVDLGENSIISNILSMDFDPWDESLTSPQNLAKLLGNNNSDKQQRVSSSSRKTQNCNQSRFSFAREEDDQIHRSNFTQNLSDFGSGLDHFRHEFRKTDAFPSQLSDVNGFSSFNFEESDRTAGNHFSLSSNKIPVSRSQISAPPGFMGPSRAPPPGFTSNERIEPQTYDNNLSGNHHMFDASSLLRKVHQAPAPPVYNNGGVTVSELEFMDPAILAIGGSRIPTNFPSQQQQHNSYENENRIRLLMQRSFSQQNHRFSDLSTDSGYSQRTTDSYGRLVEQVVPNNRSNYQQQGNYQVQQTRSSVMSNGHWDGWNEVQSGNGIGNGNDIAMAEILRNERLGFNKYYSGYEDTKFRMPSSNDLYNNRTFGI